MNPHLDLNTNEVGARFTRRFANTSQVIAQSTLPKAT